MPMPQKRSLDELLSKRKDYVRSGPSGDMLMKAFRAPATWDPTKRSARFIMSDENVDRYGDIVVQDGLDLTEFLKNPQGLLFHNSRSFPIGHWENVQKNMNGRPKRTEGDLVLLPEGVEPDADRAAGHIEHGTLRAVSIGFIPVDYETIVDDKGSWVGGFRILQSELVECSLVPVPALQTALAKDAAGDWEMPRVVIEEVLDTWAKHPETGLIVPRAAYEAALKERDGNRTVFTVSLDEFTELLMKGEQALAAKLDQTIAAIKEHASTTDASAATDTAAAEGAASTDESSSKDGGCGSEGDPEGETASKPKKGLLDGILARIKGLIGPATNSEPEPAPPAPLSAEQKAAIQTRLAAIANRVAD